MKIYWPARCTIANVEPLISNNGRRVRLTREELLAGQCFPSEKAHIEADADPRIKSPDLILERHPTSIVKNPGIDPTVKIAHLENELTALRQRYNTEIDEWKEYDRQVAIWKQQVMEAVNKLKMEAADKFALQDEIRILKAQVERFKSYVR